MRRLMKFLMTWWGALVLALLALGLGALLPLLESSLARLGYPDWQFNSYYWTVILCGIAGIWVVAWVASTLLLVRKRLVAAVARTVLGVLVAVGAFTVWVLVSWEAQPSIVGWPISTVHSHLRGRHYILAVSDDVGILVPYVILSADKTLLAVTWTVESTGIEGASPRAELLLSDDEELLVVADGDHLTAAINLDTGEVLAQSHFFYFFSKKTPEQHRRECTERIRSLLAEHAGPGESTTTGDDVP